MADLTREQLSALTRLGARARLAELVAESDAIFREFPGLAAGPKAAANGAPGNSAATSSAPRPTSGRKPRKPYQMSAANRKAAAERMRAYWAARRQASEGSVAVAEASEKPTRRGRGKRRGRAKARGAR